jgi:hypothetical protein
VADKEAPDTEAPDAPSQEPVTVVNRKVARAVAASVALVTVAMVLWNGQDGAELLVLGATAGLLLAATGALLTYILTTGQFPPRMTKEGFDLTVQEVGRLGQSLEALERVVSQLVEKVEALELATGLAALDEHDSTDNQENPVDPRT